MSHLPYSIFTDLDGNLSRVHTGTQRNSSKTVRGNVSCLIYDMFSRKADVSCNFNYLFENEGLLNVTGNQVHCKCGNISESM